MSEILLASVWGKGINFLLFRKEHALGVLAEGAPYGYYTMMRHTNGYLFNKFVDQLRKQSICINILAHLEDHQQVPFYYRMCQSLSYRM